MAKKFSVLTEQANVIKNEVEDGANTASRVGGMFVDVVEKLESLGATYAGIATPSTNPGAPDGNVFYFAIQAGTYTNFGGKILETGLNILLWGGVSWNVTNVMTIVQELGNSQTAVMSQKAVTDAINKITYPLEITFTATSSVLEYTGQNVGVHLSWNVKRKGSTITPTSVVIKRGSSQIYSGATGSGQYTDNVSQLGSISYTITVEADDMTETVSINVQQVLPMYFGFSTAIEIGSLNITGLGKQTIKTSPTGTYTLTNDTDGKYMWLCVPNTMTINRVTLNGFDVPMEAASSGSTSLGSYKCYRSSNALVAQDYTIVVS